MAAFPIFACPAVMDCPGKVISVRSVAPRFDFSHLLPIRLLRLRAVAGLLFLLRWLFICGLLGVLAGTASAGFLVALSWATHWREGHSWAVAGLPVASLGVGLAYQYFGAQAGRGTKLLLAEINHPSTRISWRMVPLVLGGTLATHLFGGSAGREGTAVQMAGALADQLAHWLRLRRPHRRLLLIAGLSAGFASVLPRWPGLFSGLKCCSSAPFATRRCCPACWPP